MTPRFFTVLSVFFSAIIFVSVLLFQERIPDPEGKAAQAQAIDPLETMRYIASQRRSNLQAFGLDEDLVEETVKKIQLLAEKDKRNAKKESLLLQSMLTNSEVAGVLCPGNSTQLPQRYASAAFLIRQENDVRKIVDFSVLRKRLEIQEWYDEVNVSGVYKKLELNEARSSEATVMGVAILIANREADFLTDSGYFAGGLFGGPSFQSMLNDHPIREDVVEYFALMHLLTELANDPRSEFCGGKRRGVDPPEEE